MANLLESFRKEGLLERVVTNPQPMNNGNLPKVNSEAPQTVPSTNQNPQTTQNDVKNAGDQNASDDPTMKADDVKPYDTVMKAAQAAMGSAESVLEHLCEMMNKRQYEADNEKQQKIQGIYESVKQLNMDLTALKGQADTAPPPQDQGQPQQPAPAAQTQTPVQNQGQLNQSREHRRLVGGFYK